jgi:hypothetical protein
MRLPWRVGSSRRKRTPGSTSNSRELADQPGADLALQRRHRPAASAPGLLSVQPFCRMLYDFPGLFGTREVVSSVLGDHVGPSGGEWRAPMLRDESCADKRLKSRRHRPDCLTKLCCELSCVDRCSLRELSQRLQDVMVEAAVVDAAYVAQRDLLSPQLVRAGNVRRPNEETSEQGETCAPSRLRCPRARGCRTRYPPTRPSVSAFRCCQPARLAGRCQDGPRAQARACGEAGRNERPETRRDPQLCVKLVPSKNLSPSRVVETVHVKKCRFKPLLEPQQTFSRRVCRSRMSSSGGSATRLSSPANLQPANFENR